MITVIQFILTLHMLNHAVAQPAATTPRNLKLTPLSAAQRASVGNAIRMVRLADHATLPVRLKVTNATLEDIAAKIKKDLSLSAPIEVRLVSVARFTFDGQATPAGQVLASVATLAGGNFYILKDRFLIAQLNQLSDEERREAKEWRSVFNDQGPGKDALERLLSQVQPVLQDTIINWFLALRKAKGHAEEVAPVEATAPIEVRMGELSPDLQQMMQYRIAWKSRGQGSAPVRLSADTVISFDDSNPSWYVLQIKALSQGAHYVSNIRRKQP